MLFGNVTFNVPSGNSELSTPLKTKCHTLLWKTFEMCMFFRNNNSRRTILQLIYCIYLLYGIYFNSSMDILMTKLKIHIAVLCGFPQYQLSTSFVFFNRFTKPLLSINFHLPSDLFIRKFVIKCFAKTYNCHIWPVQQGPALLDRPFPLESSWSKDQMLLNELVGKCSLNQCCNADSCILMAGELLLSEYNSAAWRIL